MGKNFTVFFNDGDTLEFQDIDLDNLNHGVIKIAKLEDDGSYVTYAFPLTSIKRWVYQRNATEEERATIEAIREKGNDPAQDTVTADQNKWG
jgi:hypothetical protein